MSLTLTVAHLHPALPALTAGLAISLIQDPEGKLHVIFPGSPGVMERIASAIRDGALILTGPLDPTISELEQQIMADRDRLLARADAILAASHHHALDRAG